ncbi:hypothetical protein HK101_011794 [Irineochytrium annulatum]|nr:hypothetical protein HK101_011794 [Irineochytrium annulatum]
MSTPALLSGRSLSLRSGQRSSVYLATKPSIPAACQLAGGHARRQTTVFTSCPARSGSTVLAAQRRQFSSTAVMRQSSGNPPSDDGDNGDGAESRASGVKARDPAAPVADEDDKLAAAALGKSRPLPLDPSAAPKVTLKQSQASDQPRAVFTEHSWAKSAFWSSHMPLALDDVPVKTQAEMLANIWEAAGLLEKEPEKPKVIEATATTSLGIYERNYALWAESAKAGSALDERLSEFDQVNSLYNDEYSKIFHTFMPNEPPTRDRRPLNPPTTVNVTWLDTASSPPPLLALSKTDPSHPSLILLRPEDVPSPTPDATPAALYVPTPNTTLAPAGPLFQLLTSHARPATVIVPALQKEEKSQLDIVRAARAAEERKERDAAAASASKAAREEEHLRRMVENPRRARAEGAMKLLGMNGLEEMVKAGCLEVKTVVEAGGVRKKVYRIKEEVLERFLAERERRIKAGKAEALVPAGRKRRGAK